MSVTLAARNFADVVNRAYYRHESTLLMKNGEAVARIIPVTKAQCRASDLAEEWPAWPHLSKENAEAMEKDISESRKRLRPPKPWV